MDRESSKVGFSQVLIKKKTFYSLFSFLCNEDKVLAWRQRGDSGASRFVTHWVTNGPKSPKSSAIM